MSSNEDQKALEELEREYRKLISRMSAVSKYISEHCDLLNNANGCSFENRLQMMLELHRELGIILGNISAIGAKIRNR